MIEQMPNITPRGLAKSYLFLTNNMAKKFYEIYYRDSEEEEADLERDYDYYCYMIGASSKRGWSPVGPLDINEGQAMRDINDIWTALEREIPKEILHNFWRDHREDYSNKETYYTINLWHYFRKNFDPEVYKEEQEEEKKASREKCIETSFFLDDALGVERGTSFASMKLEGVKTE